MDIYLILPNIRRPAEIWQIKIERITANIKYGALPLHAEQLDINRRRLSEFDMIPFSMADIARTEPANILKNTLSKKE